MHSNKMPVETENPLGPAIGLTDEQIQETKTFCDMLWKDDKVQSCDNVFHLLEKSDFNNAQKFMACRSMYINIGKKIALEEMMKKTLGGLRDEISSLLKD